MIRQQGLAPSLPWHPCMNEQAHSQVARLHLPVAPLCNTRCIYCRRGISKSSSLQRGPGQTEGILTPQQALTKTTSYLQKWGKNSIVGIAGPGDPLANSNTLATLSLLFQEIPDLRLCLCTNGLCLSDHVSFLQDIGMRHLTVTVNGIDPDIVKKIQPWIRYRDREYLGKEAASQLISKQLQGIEAAVAANIFVKINSVVLPGINDSHILETAQEVKRLGAGIINLIPLLTATTGDIFQSVETDTMEKLQETTSSVLPVFTKCKQCRADAEGIPGKRSHHVHQ